MSRENESEEIRTYRKKIKAAYGNTPNWVKKVNLMGEHQVIATYHQMKKSGRIK